MLAFDDDPKRNTILSAAWDAFGAYGFRKTSMNDIARGAGISRAAIYLNYNNKNDIFRAICQSVYTARIEAVALQLTKKDEPKKTFTHALDALGGPFVEAMLSAPHGLAFVDTASGPASDIAAAGEARLLAMFGSWLERGRASGQVLLPGHGTEAARALMLAVRGIRISASTVDAYRAAVHNLAVMVARGLSP